MFASTLLIRYMSSDWRGTLACSTAAAERYTMSQCHDDLAAMRRMTDSSSVNLRLASDSAAVRLDSCDLHSASTCMMTSTVTLGVLTGGHISNGSLLIAHSIHASVQQTCLAIQAYAMV